MTSKYSNLTDPELVRKSKLGDKKAFSEIYERYKVRINSYLCRYLRDYTLAKDVTVDTFLTVYRRIGQYDEMGKFGGWLYKVATNCARQALRKNKKEKYQVLDIDRPVSEQGNATLLDFIEDNKYRPDKIAGRKDLKEYLYGIIASLERKYKEVIMLCDVEGLSYEEAAEVLGDNINTVGTRLRRGRKLLYEILKENKIEAND